MPSETESVYPRMPPLAIVLASTSPYRRQLLERLGIPFSVARPEADETPLSDESPVATAHRLALAKAKAIASNHPSALIIGSDQVAYFGNQRFDKPGTEVRAIEQLRAMSGNVIVFHTAVCLLDSASGQFRTEGVPTEARFRKLNDEEIIRYVQREKPLDCAGSAKAEGLGISLLEYMRGDDPTALIGLPLIALCTMLREQGVQIP